MDRRRLRKAVPFTALPAELQEIHSSEKRVTPDGKPVRAPARGLKCECPILSRIWLKGEIPRILTVRLAFPC